MQSTSMCSASALPAVWPKPGSDVEDAFGNAGLGRELREADRRQRRLLGGLQDERIAGRERRRRSSTIAIISGKFQGTIAATTPIGSRVISASASGPVGATSS